MWPAQPSGTNLPMLGVEKSAIGHRLRATAWLADEVARLECRNAEGERGKIWLIRCVALVFCGICSRCDADGLNQPSDGHLWWYSNGNTPADERKFRRLPDHRKIATGGLGDMILILYESL